MWIELENLLFLRSKKLHGSFVVYIISFVGKFFIKKKKDLVYALFTRLIRSTTITTRTTTTITTSMNRILLKIPGNP